MIDYGEHWYTKLYVTRPILAKNSEQVLTPLMKRKPSVSFSINSFARWRHQKVHLCLHERKLRNSIKCNKYFCRWYIFLAIFSPEFLDVWKKRLCVPVAYCFLFFEIGKPINWKVDHNQRNLTLFFRWCNAYKTRTHEDTDECAHIAWRHEFADCTLVGFQFHLGNDGSEK